MRARMHRSGSKQQRRHGDRDRGARAVIRRNWLAARCPEEEKSAQGQSTASPSPSPSSSASPRRPGPCPSDSTPPPRNSVPASVPSDRNLSLRTSPSLARVWLLHVTPPRLTRTPRWLFLPLPARPSLPPSLPPPQPAPCSLPTAPAACC